jgi:hypothetical protein
LELVVIDFSVVVPRVGVTSEFKGKLECIEYMCARIKVHTCIDLVNTKTQCQRI